MQSRYVFILICPKTALEFVPREEFTWTLGRSTRYVAMPHDVLIRNAVKVLERKDEKG